MFSSATPPPPRHNFVVSAITFEGFRLRSSNLTHALLIQISRTSSIIDIVAPSKMAAGSHFVQKNNKVPYGSEMARYAIESEFRTSKMADQSEMARNAIQSDFQKSKMAAEKKICINLKWPELRSKVNFANPKWPIDLKSEIRTSKMADVSHFVKKFQK